MGVRCTDCTEADFEFLTEASDRQLVGVEGRTPAGATQTNSGFTGEVPSYDRAMPHRLQLDADVITLECASSGARDLPLFGKHKIDKKSASVSSAIATQL
jgi:hypothetical protein